MVAELLRGDLAGHGVEVLVSTVVTDPWSFRV
jgi:hypothetical protein